MLAIYKQWITDNAKWLTALFIIIAALAVSLPGAFDTGPTWPDGNRYTFNGILIHDMVRDGCLFSPYHYAVDFYSRYPAINLPYGPPFFAAIFSLAFGIFGISFSVSRCVVSVLISVLFFGLTPRLSRGPVGFSRLLDCPINTAKRCSMHLRTAATYLILHRRVAGTWVSSYPRP